jgi:hypothetical protein
VVRRLAQLVLALVQVQVQVLAQVQVRALAQLLGGCWLGRCFFGRCFSAGASSAGASSAGAFSLSPQETMLKGSKIAAANGNIVFSFIGLFFDFGVSPTRN